MIIALKVIVNNMLCFGNILHLYLSAFNYMFIPTFCLWYADECFLFLNINSWKFQTVSFDLKANRNRGTPAWFADSLNMPNISFEGCSKYSSLFCKLLNNSTLPLRLDWSTSFEIEVVLIVFILSYKRKLLKNSIFRADPLWIQKLHLPRLDLCHRT